MPEVQRGVRPNPYFRRLKSYHRSLNMDTNSSGPWESDKHKGGGAYKIWGNM